MTMKSTILAGVAALMLSASTAQGMLEKIHTELLGEPIKLGVENCMKRAEKGDLVTAHLRIRIDEESSTGNPGELIGDTRSEQGSVPFSFIMGDHGTILPALDAALKDLCAGETVRVRLPSKEAYGADGLGAIPGHADIEFEVEVVGVRMPNKTASYDERDVKKDVEIDHATEEDFEAKPAAPRPGPEAVNPDEDVIVEDDDDGEEDVDEVVEPEPEPEPEPKKKKKGKSNREFRAYFKELDAKDANNEKLKEQKPENLDYFATLDDDKDGWVSEAEFKDFTKRMNLRWSYWRAIFVTQDKDNDQRLSWWEWTGPKGRKPPSYMGFQEWGSDEE